jgi:hypothetical protein
MLVYLLFAVPFTTCPGLKTSSQGNTVTTFTERFNFSKII